MRRGRISAKEIIYVNLRNDVTDCFFRLNELCYHNNRSSNACKGEKCKQYRTGKLLQIMKDTSKEKIYEKQGDLELTTLATRRNHSKI